MGAAALSVVQVRNRRATVAEPAEDNQPDALAAHD
jgi:hypothetical protein